MADSTPRPIRGYRTFARVAVPLAGRLLRTPAAHAGHSGRLAAPSDLESWARSERDATRPLVWFHASSVGESLQSLAVLATLRARRPDLQAVVTRFSASAERLTNQFDVDHIGYVPYDRYADVERVCRAIRPDLMVFTKVDVWPELATGARRHGARTALIAGTVDPESSRLRWPSTLITRPGYRALERAGAISELDGAGLVRLGVEPRRIVVTGDPRVDSVLARVAHHRPGRGDPLLMVAGSTWRRDEEHLLAAFRTVRSRHPGARLWIVPHEPTTDAIAAIAARAASLDLPPARVGRSLEPICIIAEMGVLADRYADAGIGYVGGGFGERGVHSVLEPAAVGIPVLIGPHDRGVRDARVLAEAGGLVRISRSAPERGLTDQWLDWLDRPEEARRRGEAGRAALEADRGAAGRSAELLVELLALAPHPDA
ncbi:MAG: glycosyltransferase N-terminal domain-containing protein [Gemmatimonadota bacterium]